MPVSYEPILVVNADDFGCTRDMTDRTLDAFDANQILDLNSGASGTVLALGDAYSQLGNDVQYISLDDLPIHLPGRAAALAFPPFVAVQLTRRRYRNLDVIDASTGDTWLWATLKRGRRQPLLVTRSHGFEHLFHEHTVEHARRTGRTLSRRYNMYWGGWRLMEVRRTLRLADLVLALNERERDYAVERLGVDDNRIRLVSNGVESEFLDRAAAVNRVGGSTSLAYVGEYREMKGVEYGTRAMVGAMQARADLRVSFIGTGVPQARVLEQFPADLHSRVTVKERFRRDELPDLLEGQGILLFPSLSEGFGKALLEGMACGLAPVAARSAGAEQLVDDERNGLLVSTHDAKALEAAVLRLLDDRDLLQRLQAEARRSAAQYSWSRVAAKTLDFYREALERRCPAS